MPRRPLSRMLYFALVAALLTGLLPIQAPQILAASPTFYKIIVDNSDTKTTGELVAGGATRLVDYGSFSLWKTSGSPNTGLLARRSVALRTDFDSIQLRGGVSIFTPGPAPTIPKTLSQAKASGFQFWMVQFVGPIKSDWLDNLRANGIEPVSYMPNNAYVVWADGAGVSYLESQVSSASIAQWSGAYHPAYRLAPALQSTKTKLASGQPVAVTVQFYNTKAVQSSLSRLRALGGKVFKQPSNTLNFVDISLEVPAGELENIAGWADVFNVEPWAAPQKNDEAQGQILAGNLTTITNTIPSGPGYLSWLASKGFPTDAAQYPLVDVVDDGIDTGNLPPSHPDFHFLGVLTDTSRLIYDNNCTTDPKADGQDGHGNLNAGIMGGYNNSTGFPYQDGFGYRLGLGVSPYGRIGGTKIFANGGTYNVTNCGNNDQGVVAASYNAGATMTSNSWGATVSGAYDASAQAYDALTRDASSTTSGNQQMLHIFAAGNAGLGGSQTIESPGTAKNVLTVGATENVRDDGIADGCGWTNSNNADDIATFSSRGPTTDQRTKPDIMAPGIHVQGPASQDPTYNATGICGSAGSPKLYYPAGQTLYSWSSGTSHSTPAVAGAASLLYNYYGRVLNPGQTPSPAMLKALLLNSPRYLNGNETGGTLPSNNQGWGDANLGMLFDGTPRFLQDQNFTFNATGQVYTKTMAVADNTKPLRVSLVWTDAPGSTTGNAYVNDLNLEVTVGGNTYKGNVFLGANSTTGGAFDTRNNVENVFLPAGVSGTLSVKVTAANLAANAIPGSGFTTAQDFALVVYNANNPVPAPVIVQNNISFSDANGNGLIDPGETVNLNLALGNGGDTGASGVTGVVAVTGGNATIVQNSSAYANIAPGAVVTNTTPYSFTVNPGAACGSIITFTQTVSYSEVGSPVSFNFSLPTGQTQLGNPVTYTSTDIPKAIPDDVATGITSTVGINSSKPVGKVTVKVNITHTWVGDLVIKLISPQGTAVTLASRPGSSGNNGDNLKDIVFDDAAATPIANLPVGQTDYTGSYRPDTPLSALNGQAINGTWKLVVADVASQDTGTLNSWSLNIQPALYICGPFSITPNSGTTPQAAGLNNPFPGLLQATVLDVASQPVAGVNVTFTAPGSGASGTFQGGGTTYITTTNSSGIATAPPFSANSTAGSYAVTATVASAATPATFNLSNLTPCIVVSNTSDTGSPGTCGTLSYAMQSASPGDTITFNLGANNHTVSVTGPLPALAPGAKIDGGSCAAGPNIIIQAVPGAGATNGLILTSNNWLMNLKITGFPNRQITVPNGGGNHLGQCVVAVR